MLGEPIRDRRAERHEATRAEILDAAWEVARENGLAGISLRDVARRVGMQAPSLYSYFVSKNDIHDAMFAQAWSDCLDMVRSLRPTLPAETRAALKVAQHAFFDFVVKDQARYLLMAQRTIPGFEPSAASYQPAIDTLNENRSMLATFGITDQADIDLYIGINAGLVAQQTANEPGGSRWKVLIDRAIDMYCDALGVAPAAKKRASSRSRQTRQTQKEKR